jgi:hypothetical protein
MTVLQYDPKQVTVTLTNAKVKLILTGFADDDFIDVERDEDAFMKKTGVDGQTTRAKNNNHAGKITVKLMQSSSSNDDLTGIAVADENDMTGVCSLLCKDSSGSSVFSAQSAWVKKFPKQTFKKDVNVYEWVIDTDELSIFAGGNPKA